MAKAIRLLLIEDSADDAQGVLADLRGAGFDPTAERVASADGLRAALAAGPWDVVLSDHALPGLNARSVLRIVRDHDPHIPFLVVSGTIGEEAAVEMMRAGAADCLVKGNLARLPLAVEREVEGANARRARRQAEEANLFLAALVNTSVDAIISESLEGVVRSWNPAAERLYGYTAAEAVGRPIRSLIPPDEKTGPAGVMDVIRRGEAVEPFETVRVPQAGSRLDVAVSLSPVRDAAGRLVGVSKIARDITARKQAERERARLVHDLGERVKELRVLHQAATLLQDDAAEPADLFARIAALLPAAWQYPEVAAARIACDGTVAATPNFRESPWRLAVPITAVGCTGMIEVVYLEERPAAAEGPFLREEREVLDSLAQMIRGYLERRRSAAALRASEARFKALVEKSFDAVVLLDADGTIRYASPACERIGGRPVAEYVGRNMRAWVHPDDQPEHARRWADLLARPGGASHGLVRFRRADGTWGYSESTNTNLLDDPDVRAVVANFRDVTERVQAEAERQRMTQELSQASRLLQAVADNAPDAIFVKDRAGKYLLFNEAAARFVGRPVEAVLGRDDAELFDPASARLVMERDRRVMESGQVCTEEEELTAAGTTRVYQATKVPYRDASGTVIGLIGISRDITAQKEVERRLARDAQILANVRDAVIVTDPDGITTYWNAGATALFGWTADEMTGRPLADRFPESERAWIAEQIGRRVSGEEWVGEYLDWRKDGSRVWIDARVTRIIDPAGRVTGVVGVSRDITAQKQAEESIQRRERHLRAIIEATPECVKVVDPDGRLVDMNPAGLAMVEADDIQAVRGSCLLELVAPEYREQFRDLHTRVRQGSRGSLAFDIFGLRGTRRSMETHAVPLALSEGQYVLAVTRDVTAQKQAEAAVRASEERFRALVNNSWDGIALLDQTGTITFASPSTVRILGYAPDELVGQKGMALVHPDDAPDVEAALAEVWAQSGHSVTRAFRYRHKEGAWRWLETTATNLLADPQVRGVLLTSRDVTEMRAAVDALTDSEERFRQLADAMPQIVWVTRPDGYHEYYNRQWYEYTGLTYEQTRGEGWNPVFHPEDQPVAWEKWRHSLATGDPYQIEYRCRRHDGRYRWFLGRALPQRDDDGRIVRWFGTCTDIHEFKQAEETLRLQERAIRAVTQGILITDPNRADNPIVFASPGFERLTGYAAPEVVGRNCRFLQGPDTDPAAVGRARQAVRDGRAVTVELLNYKKDGTPFWNELSISPVRDEAGRLTHFVGVQTDVTDRRRLEEQFRQSQKMEAVGRLAGGVAHDFNNLLTVINGYSEVLLQTTQPDDPARDLLAEIHKAGERSAGLTRQLLAFSRQQVLAPRILDLNTVIGDMERMLRRVIGEDVRLETDLDPELAPVRADAGQTEQVLLNLCVNARDAMPTGGRLTIATRNVLADDRFTQAHPAARPGAYVLVAVTDTGSGMTPDVKARIFEPFFTTKGPGKGTGLGLATVFGIVSQSDGVIEVDSEAGRGTTFRIYLPRAAAGDGPAARPSLHGEPPRGTETVLMVEDEPGVRALTRHVLEAWGYTVLAAADADQAVRMADEHAGPIDLLITDVVMPDSGGRAVAEQVTRRLPGIRVLYVSGYTDDAVVRHGVLIDSVNFLQKPFAPAALAHKVREVLDGPAPRS